MADPARYTARVDKWLRLDSQYRPRDRPRANPHEAGRRMDALSGLLRDICYMLTIDAGRLQGWQAARTVDDEMLAEMHNRLEGIEARLDDLAAWLTTVHAQAVQGTLRLDALPPNGAPVAAENEAAKNEAIDKARAWANQRHAWHADLPKRERRPQAG